MLTNISGQKDQWLPWNGRMTRRDLKEKDLDDLKKVWEVMGRLIILIVVLASQCLLMSKLRKLHIEYAWFIMCTTLHVCITHANCIILHIMCNT